jgi:parallel beta-helix repeat protein
MNLGFSVKLLGYRNIVLLSSLIFTRQLLGYGATYYVSKSGNDTNSCSQAQSSRNPKSTIVGGVACMSGGDRLIIGDGTYDDQILNTIPGGSAEAPTILQAQNHNQAIVQPLNPKPGYAVFNVNRSYITFDGLVADATNCYDNGGWYITDSGSTTTNIVIKNGTARNATRVPSHWQASGSGILTNVGAANHQIINMDLYNNLAYGIYLAATGVLVEGNRIYDNQGYGIHVYNSFSAVNNAIIRNNTIYRNGIGSLTQAAGILLSSGSGNTAYDNTVYGNQNGIFVRYSCSACMVYNNTIYANTNDCLFMDPSSSGSKLQDNICR